MIDFVCTFCFFVSQIEKNKSRCFVRFEDQSEYWILFKDLQKGMVLQNIKCLVILQIRMYKYNYVKDHFSVCVCTL